MPRFRNTRAEILNSYDEREVMRLVREAVGNIPSEEIRTLPQECVAALADADVHAAAVVLLRADLAHRGEPGIGELLRQLAELFASASVRVTEITHRRSPTS